MIWNSCPDTEQLYRLWSEQLDPQDEPDSVGHIKQCENCQELEVLTLGRVRARHVEDQSANQATGQGSSIRPSARGYARTRRSGPLAARRVKSTRSSVRDPRKAAERRQWRPIRG